jgi:hypothetical protein
MKKVLIIATVVLIIGVVAYMYFKKKNKKEVVTPKSTGAIKSVGPLTANSDKTPLPLTGGVKSSQGTPSITIQPNGAQISIKTAQGPLAVVENNKGAATLLYTTNGEMVNPALVKAGATKVLQMPAVRMN